MAFPIKRGEVWMVDLKPQTHSEEPAKERPCLVIQADEINAIHQTIIVIPISSSPEAAYPKDDPIHVHVGAFAKENRKPPDHSWALVDCVRSVSRKRFSGEAAVHRCPVAAMTKIERSLRLFLAL